MPTTMPTAAGTRNVSAIAKAAPTRLGPLAAAWARRWPWESS